MKHKISVAVFDSRPQDAHAKKVLKLFSEKAPNCEIRLIPIYNEHGQLEVSKFQKALDVLPADIQVLHLSWNQFFEPQFQGVIKALHQQIQKGKVVVAASGESQDANRINGPLKETVMGQVPGAILVGELDGKGKLTSRAFFGPELTAAWSAPSGYRGSSFSSILLTAELCKRGVQNQNWPTKFKSIKERSSKIWPPLIDYFD